MYGTSFYGCVAFANDITNDAVGIIQVNGPGNPWPVQAGPAIVASGPLLGAERSIPKGRRL